MFSHYKDLALKKPVETQFSMNYNTCCWTANIYVARKLVATPSNATSDTINDLFYDNKFGVNFELRFGSYGSGVSRMLKRGLMPYVEPYSIN